MKRYWIWGLFFLSTILHAEALYTFANTVQEQQFMGLLHELRCLVCQNQDLADSNASLAQDLREVVYLQIKAGNSRAQIIDFLRARYGDFILFNPPLKSLTGLLWMGPFLFLGFGFLIFWKIMRHE